MSADDTSSVSRRGFLRVATGTAAASAAVGTAAGQEGNSTNTTSTSTSTPSGNETSSGNESSSGSESSSGGGGNAMPPQTVTVGPGGSLVFEPADLEITPGTTVNFVWDSDQHNIVVGSQPEGANWSGTEGGESQTYDTGHEYSHTFETEGEYDYHCAPHLSAGMEATITVSADAGSDSGGGGGPPAIPDSAKTLGIASVIGMMSTLGLAYFLMRYGGDYEQE